MAHTIHGYIFHAAIYCPPCGEALPETDPEGNDKHPVFSWEVSGLEYVDDVTGETIPSHCDKCGEEID